MNIHITWQLTWELGPKKKKKSTQDKEKKLDYGGNVDIMFVAAEYTIVTSGLAQ